jgi:hypothetical protein
VPSTKLFKTTHDPDEKQTESTVTLVSLFTAEVSMFRNPRLEMNPEFWMQREIQAVFDILNACSVHLAVAVT